MNKRALWFLGAVCALAVWAGWARGVALSPGTAFPQGTYTAGDYTISFEGKDQFRVSIGEKVLVEGEYTIEEDRLRLTDKRGPIACTRAGQEVGTYAWEFESETLTLTKVEDPCQPRAVALTAQPWTTKK